MLLGLNQANTPWITPWSVMLISALSGPLLNVRPRPTLSPKPNSITGLNMPVSAGIFGTLVAVAALSLLK